MASQELYASVADQLDAAIERLTAAVGNYEWDEAGANATAIAELAKVMTNITAELDAE